MTYYVPGTEEKDPSKIIMSLQQVHGNTATNTTNIATNTANIATNTTNIATNTTNIATLQAGPLVAGAVASQADQEAATDITKGVTPGRQQFHPSAVKAWVRFDASSGTPTIVSSYNVGSLTDNGVGDTTINFTTAFSNANYCFVCWGDLSTAAQGTGRVVQVVSVAAGALRILTTTTAAATGEDWAFVCVQVMGDQ